jgi:hypothetical protein
MIEVKLTFGTYEEAQQFFLHAAVRATAPVALNDIPVEVQEAAAPAKRTRKSKNAEAEQAQAEPAAVAPAQDAMAEPEAAAEEDAPAAEVVQDKSYTVDDVRQALQAYVGRTDFGTGLALVKSFGASRITELKTEDYAAFIAKTEEKVAREPARQHRR